ncbi:MAG: helix-turn-helix domain-containing protein [Acidimicrobiales bacterium]
MVHLTQVEVAEMAGIPQAQISRIERGVVSPTSATLAKIAEALGADLGLVERFRREVQAAAGLSHPNIVAVYDPTERTAGIGAVTDFGIAQAARWGAGAQLTQTGLVLGTAAYLSPEQAEGRIADARSEVYAIGVVLYEMATGRPPFRGDNPVSVAYQHAREHPEPPSRISPKIPFWLQAVILKALAKSPDQRYSDAEDLRSDLSRGASAPSAEAPTVPVMLAPTAVFAAPTQQDRSASATSRPPTRSAGFAPMAIVVEALIGAAIYFGASGPSGSHAAGHGASTARKPSSTSTHPTTTKPPASRTTATTSPPATTSQPTSFAGYQIVAGRNGQRSYPIAAGHITRW